MKAQEVMQIKGCLPHPHTSMSSISITPLNLHTQLIQILITILHPKIPNKFDP